MNPPPSAATGEIDSFFEELAASHLSPLWTQYRNLMPKQPRPSSQAYLWPYTDLKAHLTRAGELVDHEEAIRRSLNLVNPAAEKVAAVGNIYAAVQLVLPGEVAPSHRHGAAAMRFIIEGSGGFTAVNGERAVMTPGDLILTPSFAWHDHGNETDEPMIWLDGLDMPLINALETSFYEADEVEAQKLVRPDDASTKTWGQPGLMPLWTEWDEPYSPLFKYPWKETEEALLGAAEVSDGSAEDGIIFEYVNPLNGGPVMPTMSCFAQLLKPGLTTAAHRHTASTMYHVVRGEGATVVDGERFEWGPRDTFAVPGWAVHHHENGSGQEQALLFSFSDAPVQKRLGLYREEGA